MVGAVAVRTRSLLDGVEVRGIAEGELFGALIEDYDGRAMTSARVGASASTNLEKDSGWRAYKTISRDSAGT